MRIRCENRWFALQIEILWAIPALPIATDPASEAAPQTDECHADVRGAAQATCGLRTLLRSAAVTAVWSLRRRCPYHDGSVGSPSPAARAMNVARNAPEAIARHVTLRGRVARSWLLQRLPAAAADRRRHRRLLLQPSPPAGGLLRADGSHDARLRDRRRALRPRPGCRPGPLPQGRPHPAVPAPVARRRGRAVHRQEPGEVARAAHPRRDRSGDGLPQRLAALLDRDGEQLLHLLRGPGLRALLPQVLLLPSRSPRACA